MSPVIPKTMKASVMDKFGGPNVLRPARIPVPEPGNREILVRVHTAGIGSWDPWLREGGMGGTLPLVLGSDGSGTVVAVGPKARRFKSGDKVYAYTFENPKGGFYAEYAAVPEDAAAPAPSNISLEEAGALAACGLTAIAGLETIQIKPGRSLLLTGASGGVGHLTLQLAKRLGARVLAVASGRDGVELAKRLGADAAVNGKAADVSRAAREFAPEGFDAALVFANAARLAGALQQVKTGGLIAYPEGVDPEPKDFAGIEIVSFNGLSSPKAFERLNSLIARGPFRVEIAGRYKLDEMAQAHRDVPKHHLGKPVLKLRP